MEKFINDLVNDFNNDLLSNSDIQDIIEGYCLMNDADYEEIYNIFYKRVNG